MVHDGGFDQYGHVAVSRPTYNSFTFGMVTRLFIDGLRKPAVKPVMLSGDWFSSLMEWSGSVPLYMCLVREKVRVERFQEKGIFYEDLERVGFRKTIEPSCSHFSPVCPVSFVTRAAPARRLRRGARALLIARGAPPMRPAPRDSAPGCSRRLTLMRPAPPTDALLGACEARADAACGAHVDSRP
jgi:hypothetical protein